jgi:DNA polymerase-3 subunit epsilon
MIKGGDYVGYGFIEKTEVINHIHDLEAYLIPQRDNSDIQKILRPRLLKI